MGHNSGNLRAVGFRPNRRAQDAIAEIHHYGTSGYRWVLECDIKACFDEIDHTALMDRLRARIKDKRICALVKAFLKSGVLTDLGDREETLTGTPQGGILSPLLANVALSALDDHFDRQWHQEMGSDGQRRKRRRDGKGNWKIIRYADDFVLMVHGERRHAEALREEVAAVLAPMGLRLAPEKTAVVHLDEGFTFLGFDIRRMRKRGTQKYYVYTKPSKKAIQAIKDKVRTKTYRSTRHMGLDELITSLNRSLAGWANYFRHGVSKAVFSDVDSHAWHRLMRWIRAKYKHGNHRIGMPELRRRFCDQGWRFACNGVVFTGASSVAVTRYRYRGSTIPTPWTPARSLALLTSGQDTWSARCGERRTPGVRREALRRIPYSAGRNSEEMFLGRLAYLAGKPGGDKSMPGTRRPSGGVQGGVPLDPHGMAKAGLLEAQSPAVNVRTHRNDAWNRCRVMSRHEPVGRGTLRDAERRPARAVEEMSGRPNPCSIRTTRTYRGIAYGARALWRRSARSSQRPGKPVTRRRGTGGQ